MEEEGSREDTQLDDDPLYEDDPDGGLPVKSIFDGVTSLPPGCAMTVVALVGCVFVALALVTT